MTQEERIQALVNYLNISAEEVNPLEYGENEFETEKGDFMVLTDDEADDKAAEYIKETLWAFNADFIMNNSSAFNELTSNEFSKCEKAIREMQSNLCESANPIVRALIDDIEYFVASAINADGRGHFLSTYDGEEIEEGEVYIYRTN